MEIENYKMKGKRTKTVLFAGKRLKPGEDYILSFAQTEDGRRLESKKKKMKLIALYEHFARFEDMYGVRYSFRYWDLEKMLKRGAYYE